MDWLLRKLAKTETVDCTKDKPHLRSKCFCLMFFYVHDPKKWKQKKCLRRLYWWPFLKQLSRKSYEEKWQKLKLPVAQKSKVRFKRFCLLCANEFTNTMKEKDFLLPLNRNSLTIGLKFENFKEKGKLKQQRQKRKQCLSKINFIAQNSKMFTKKKKCFIFFVSGKFRKPILIWWKKFVWNFDEIKNVVAAKVILTNNGKKLKFITLAETANLPIKFTLNSD